MKKTTSGNMFAAPKREDYDPTMLGDTAFEWATERWLMENHKKGPGYAKSVANELTSMEESRVNPNGVEQTGRSMNIR